MHFTRMEVYSPTASRSTEWHSKAQFAQPEIRITAESTGTVSNISVKVGDRVQKDQQLLRMDDRDAQLAVKQASVELQAAREKLDRFRGQLADADARVAISQRQEQ